MTRPLVALRSGARRLVEDPTSAEPVTLGRRDAARGDEFAGLVQSVSQLHENLGSQRARVAKLAAERGHLIEERQHLAAQIAEVRQECEELRRLKDEVQARLDGLRDRVHSSFVNLALRTLGLVERQLTVIETMEESEQDPERLDTLFTLDHLATGIRRYSENLLVIAGSERQSNHPGPVPLLDVLRAAISEVERYQRIRIQALPPQVQVAGFASDSISHLIAELLENATVFSPPGTEVHVSGWLMESGEVMLSVQDEGISMTPERFDELNARLADPVPDYCQGPQPEDPLGLGLYVVTRLAARHGVRVQLREQKQGGVTAVVVLPRQILPQPLPVAGSARSVALRTDPTPGITGGAPAPHTAPVPHTAPAPNIAPVPNTVPGPASQAAGTEAVVLDQSEAYDPAASRTAHDPVSHDPAGYDPAAYGSAAHDDGGRAAGADPGIAPAPPTAHAAPTTQASLAPRGSRRPCRPRGRGRRAPGGRPSRGPGPPRGCPASPPRPTSSPGVMTRRRRTSRRGAGGRGARTPSRTPRSVAASTPSSTGPARPAPCRGRASRGGPAPTRQSRGTVSRWCRASARASRRRPAHAPTGRPSAVAGRPNRPASGRTRRRGSVRVARRRDPPRPWPTLGRGPGLRQGRAPRR